MGNMGLGEHTYFRLLGCSSYVVFPSNRYVLHFELSKTLLGDTGYAEGFALVSEVHELQRLAVLHILDEGDDRL